MKILTLNQANIQDFSTSRNQLMADSQSDWVMFLDTDETISSQLQVEINQAMKDKTYNYQFKRQDTFLGQKHKFGETASTRFIRLIQPNTGTWQGRVHERFISSLPIKTLTTPLNHEPLTVTSLLTKLNHYSSLRADELKHFSLFQLLFYPPLKFLQNYVFRLGFLDGLSGLGIAFLMSLHSLFVRVKTYEKTKKT